MEQLWERHTFTLQADSIQTTRSPPQIDHPQQLPSVSADAGGCHCSFFTSTAIMQQVHTSRPLSALDMSASASSVSSFAPLMPSLLLQQSQQQQPHLAMQPWALPLLPFLQSSPNPFTLSSHSTRYTAATPQPVFALGSSSPSAPVEQVQVSLVFERPATSTFASFSPPVSDAAAVPLDVWAALSASSISSLPYMAPYAAHTPSGEWAEERLAVESTKAELAAAILDIIQQCRHRKRKRAQQQQQHTPLTSPTHTQLGNSSPLPSQPDSPPVPPPSTATFTRPPLSEREYFEQYGQEEKAVRERYRQRQENIKPDDERERRQNSELGDKEDGDRRETKAQQRRLEEERRCIAREEEEKAERRQWEAEKEEKRRRREREEEEEESRRQQRRRQREEDERKEEEEANEREQQLQLKREREGKQREDDRVAEAQRRRKEDEEERQRLHEKRRRDEEEEEVERRRVKDEERQQREKQRREEEDMERNRDEERRNERQVRETEEEEADRRREAERKRRQALEKEEEQRLDAERKQQRLREQEMQRLEQAAQETKREQERLKAEEDEQKRRLLDEMKGRLANRTQSLRSPPPEQEKVETRTEAQPQNTNKQSQLPGVEASKVESVENVKVERENEDEHEMEAGAEEDEEIDEPAHDTDTEVEHDETDEYTSRAVDDDKLRSTDDVPITDSRRTAQPFEDAAAAAHDKHVDEEEEKVPDHIHDTVMQQAAVITALTSSNSVNDSSAASPRSQHIDALTSQLLAQFTDETFDSIEQRRQRRKAEQEEEEREDQLTADRRKRERMEREDRRRQQREGRAKKELVAPPLSPTNHTPQKHALSEPVTPPRLAQRQVTPEQVDALQQWLMSTLLDMEPTADAVELIMHNNELSRAQLATAQQHMAQLNNQEAARQHAVALYDADTGDDYTGERGILDVSVGSEGSDAAMSDDSYSSLRGSIEGAAGGKRAGGMQSKEYVQQLLQEADDALSVAGSTADEWTGDELLRMLDQQRQQRSEKRLLLHDEDQRAFHRFVADLILQRRQRDQQHNGTAQPWQRRRAAGSIAQPLLSVLFPSQPSALTASSALPLIGASGAAALAPVVHAVSEAARFASRADDEWKEGEQSAQAELIEELAEQMEAQLLEELTQRLAQLDAASNR